MDDLPNELLLEIFNYLDRESLKEILSVSKRFRELIISNSSLMRRLPMTLSKNWMNKIDFARNYGEFVKILKMNYCSFDSFEEFKKFLNLFPRVEKLNIFYIYIKQHENESSTSQECHESDSTSFTSLKSVKISSKFWGYITQLDSKILRHINTEDLEELFIKLPMQKFSSEFIDFLCKQRKLKTLEVFDEFIDSFLFDDFTESLTYNNFISSLFEIDLSELVTFQLKRFAIHYRGDHRENLSKFLKAQHELEELEIRKYEDNFTRFKITFDLMRDLRVRKLCIPLELIPSNSLNEVDRYVNRNVRDLCLTGVNNNSMLFSLLLKIFPNIKTLRLEYMLEFPCDALTTLSRLENIYVQHFKIECLQNIKIPKFRKLEIGNLYPFVYTDWENVTKINPTIQEIVIKEISHFNTMTAIKNSIGILLRDLKQLKYLKIIQNDSFDCLKIVADIKHKRLRLSSYATKMCKDLFVQAHRYDAINFLF
ncbi:CLUMA_CG015155, isoform A [Clunio marinus]|uniref:CLUMA_CG015155, isoform A n=1 Tax=Clunio marinus TaxID=568069 RepID=A0A1J1IP49_9DIPT|nr:CLUMA_CG015155, isoform A [Clunio marinus]